MRSCSCGRSGKTMPFDRPRFLRGRILRNEGRGEIFYRIEAAIPEPGCFVPGQFAMVAGWPGNDPLLPRPLALFRAGGTRGKGKIEFVYKVVGRGTALLSGLHPGDPLSFTLPLGRGFDLGQEGKTFWLVGGGGGFSSGFPAAGALGGRRAGVPRRCWNGCGGSPRNRSRGYRSSPADRGRCSGRSQRRRANGASRRRWRWRTT